MTFFKEEDCWFIFGPSKTYLKKNIRVAVIEKSNKTGVLTNSLLYLDENVASIGLFVYTLA